MMVIITEHEPEHDGILEERVIIAAPQYYLKHLTTIIETARQSYECMASGDDHNIDDKWKVGKNGGSL